LFRKHPRSARELYEEAHLLWRHRFFHVRDRLFELLQSDFARLSKELPDSSL
jgi:hypothetical protein